MVRLGNAVWFEQKSQELVMDDIAVGATKEGGILVAITAADQGDANPCEVQVELTILGS